jgi:hypothetical protein
MKILQIKYWFNSDQINYKEVQILEFGTFFFISFEHGGNRATFEMMTSTLPLGTLCSTVSWSRKSWYEIQVLEYRFDRYIYSICRCCRKCVTYKWKFHKFPIKLLFVKDFIENKQRGFHVLGLVGKLSTLIFISFIFRSIGHF